jgi:hypothetical protein
MQEDQPRIVGRSYEEKAEPPPETRWIDTDTTTISSLLSEVGGNAGSQVPNALSALRIDQGLIMAE